MGTAGMGYATYQFAEATLWPDLTLKSYSLGEIEHYVGSSRYSLMALLMVLWNSHGLAPFTVLLFVTAVALLQPGG
jgi:hypothetical protein